MAWTKCRISPDGLHDILAAVVVFLLALVSIAVFLTPFDINGIGRGRIRDILEWDLACVGVRAPRGQCEMIGGVAIVLDADTLQVAGERLPRRQRARSPWRLRDAVRQSLE